MKRFLAQRPIRYGVSFHVSHRVYRRREGRVLFEGRSLRKPYLANNFLLRTLQLRCQVSARDRFQVDSCTKQLIRNVWFQQGDNRDLVVGRIPIVQERAATLLLPVFFCQFQSGQRANLTARFGWC